MQPPKKLPHVGLGLHHGDPKRPNQKALTWAKRRMKVLKSRGYRRAVIERDVAGGAYFDKLAMAAEKMGFAVEREPERGFKEHSRYVKTTPISLFSLRKHGVMSVKRSRGMSLRAFNAEGSLVIGGANHVVHIDRHIAPQRGIPFVAEYDKKPTKNIVADSERAWEDYSAQHKRGRV